QALLPVAQELGLVSVPIGEEGHLHLESFGLEGGRTKSLRQSRSRLLRQGLTFEFWEAPHSPHQLNLLSAVSQGWLAAKRFRESRFGLGWFDRDYLEQCSVAVVRDAREKVQAFASCFYPASGNAVGLDLLRHLPSAPTGIMDLLVVELALHHQECGYRMLNLGLSPLASEVSASGWTHHSLAAARRVLQTLVPYNFGGLRRFKNKFRPEWQPRYMLLPRRRDLIPAALMAWSVEPRLSGLWLNP
ncbi:MAG: DUF2156 domain-containing protein, partial [Candidatus Eisenbacteria bacterium]|nr:DUF2156 domain-containing protein [Candidatus Eisenbacteria bacterium]